MEIEKGGEKKSNSFLKKLERCLSSTDKEAKPSTKTPMKKLSRSQSWQLISSTSSAGGFNSGKSNPNGYFSVYVGPEKQRFVIKAKVANHPLFKMLLEDAELEYGFHNGGPLLIPCDVNIFYKVLADMDSGYQVDQHASGSSHGRSSPLFVARTRSFV